MTLNVVFTCQKCWLYTPTFANVPDGTEPERPIVLSATCHHCDAPMSMEFASLQSLVNWCKPAPRLEADVAQKDQVQ